MNFGIVGCGLIGAKRAEAVRRSGNRVSAVADLDLERARALTDEFGFVTRSYDELVVRRDVEVVVVATSHDFLAPVTLAAVEAGKPVLVEKPAARSVGELDPVIAAASSKGVPVQVGYNHRWHPAFRQARTLHDQGILGDLLYVRGRYGHGGRPGYEREWRSHRSIAGGGELIDQGAHLIDLAGWFLGEFEEVAASLHTYFWGTDVEDNAFLLLQTRRRQVAQLHASWTEWKNLFSFELFGRQGKIEVGGLGRSYGTERLTLYRMLPQMGPPEATTWEYNGPDQSWRHEVESFARAVEQGTPPEVGLTDARAVLDVVQRAYEKGAYEKGAYEKGAYEKGAYEKGAYEKGAR